MGHALIGTRPYIEFRVMRCQAFLESYLAALKAGNCTGPTPLYIASGLLTYLNASGEHLLTRPRSCA